MKENWIIDFVVRGRYPEDGECNRYEGPYTEAEAKQLAQSWNKRQELAAALDGADISNQRWTLETEMAIAIELQRTESVDECEREIGTMQRKLKENKRRGSPDGSDFEVPSDLKAGRFNLGDKLKQALG